jgi:hypothetical protein
MNESTLTRLKVLVERAVRPVQASTSRRRIMREELLAHVTAVFHEETAKPGDEHLALERTQQRFGPAAELTARLQEAVPASDRWVRLLEGASTLELALRYALLALLPVALVETAFFVRGPLPAWPVLVALPALSFVTAFLAVSLVGGMRDALFGPTGRSWRKAAVVGAASWLLIPCITFALCLALSGDWRASLTGVLPLIPAALVTPAALIGLAPIFAASARERQEWAKLQID